MLAFGVQGTADALTFGNHSSSDGDLRTVYQNQEFKITVPATRKGAEDKPKWKETPSKNADGESVTITDDNKYYNDANSDGKYQSSETTGDYDDAHYYDQEKVTITVEGSAELKKVGSYNVPGSGVKSLEMFESTHDDYADKPNHQRLSGSFGLTLAPTGVGTVVIKVTDTSDAGDRKGDAAVISFTVYVVNYKSTSATSLTFATGTLTADNYKFGWDDSHDEPIQITVAPAANTPITLEVVDGPGKLYVEKTYTGDFAGSPKSKSSSNSKIETSSNAAVASGGDTGADVYLDMKGGTNRVTIRAPNVNPVTAIFVYGYPSIDIVSGDDQSGGAGGRLEDPLVVKSNR